MGDSAKDKCASIITKHWDVLVLLLNLALALWKYPEDKSSDIINSLLFVSLNARFTGNVLNLADKLKIDNLYGKTTPSICLSCELLSAVVDIIGLVINAGKGEEAFIALAVTNILLSFAKSAWDFFRLDELKSHLFSLFGVLVQLGASLAIQLLMFASAPRFVFSNLDKRGPQITLSVIVGNVIFTLLSAFIPKTVAALLFIPFFSFMLITEGLIVFSFAGDFATMPNSYAYLTCTEVSFCLFAIVLGCVCCVFLCFLCLPNEQKEQLRQNLQKMDTEQPVKPTTVECPPEREPGKSSL